MRTKQKRKYTPENELQKRTYTPEIELQKRTYTPENELQKRTYTPEKQVSKEANKKTKWPSWSFCVLLTAYVPWYSTCMVQWHIQLYHDF